MIFGFNTDVKHGDTIYHVQSEARESEKLLQTQVFMRGRCIGKRQSPTPTPPWKPASVTLKKSSSCATSIASSSEAIREGKLDDVLDRAETETLAAIKQLDVQWENASSVHADGNLTMRLRVAEDGTAVPSARLTFRFARAGAAPFYTQAVTDSTGAAEISLQVDEAALPIPR